MAKNALENSRRKINILRKKVARLQKRVKKYEDILKQNGERKEDPISDDDFTWPLEEDSMIDRL